jgi:hypothetical protein
VGFEPTTPGLKGTQVRERPFRKSGKRMFPLAARSFRRVWETTFAPVAHVITLATAGLNRKPLDHCPRAHGGFVALVGRCDELLWIP